MEPVQNFTLNHAAKIGAITLTAATITALALAAIASVIIISPLIFTASLMAAGAFLVLGVTCLIIFLITRNNTPQIIAQNPQTENPPAPPSHPSSRRNSDADLQPPAPPSNPSSRRNSDAELQPPAPPSNPSSRRNSDASLSISDSLIVRVKNIRLIKKDTCPLTDEEIVGKIEQLEANINKILLIEKTLSEYKILDTEIETTLVAIDENIQELLIADESEKESKISKLKDNLLDLIAFEKAAEEQTVDLEKLFQSFLEIDIRFDNTFEYFVDKSHLFKLIDQFKTHFEDNFSHRHKTKIILTQWAEGLIPIGTRNEFGYTKNQYAITEEISKPLNTLIENLSKAIYPISRQINKLKQLKEGVSIQFDQSKTFQLDIANFIDSISLESEQTLGSIEEKSGFFRYFISYLLPLNLPSSCLSNEKLLSFYIHKNKALGLIKKTETLEDHLRFIAESKKLCVILLDLINDLYTNKKLESAHKIHILKICRLYSDLTPINKEKIPPYESFEQKITPLIPDILDNWIPNVKNSLQDLLKHHPQIIATTPIHSLIEGAKTKIDPSIELIPMIQAIKKELTQEFPDFKLDLSDHQIAVEVIKHEKNLNALIKLSESYSYSAFPILNPIDTHFILNIINQSSSINDLIPFILKILGNNPDYNFDYLSDENRKLVIKDIHLILDKIAVVKDAPINADLKFKTNLKFFISALYDKVKNKNPENEKSFARIFSSLKKPEYFEFSKLNQFFIDLTNFSKYVDNPEKVKRFYTDMLKGMIFLAEQFASCQPQTAHTILNILYLYSLNDPRLKTLIPKQLPELLINETPFNRYELELWLQEVSKELECSLNASMTLLSVN